MDSNINSTFPKTQKKISLCRAQHILNFCEPYIMLSQYTHSFQY